MHHLLSQQLCSVGTITILILETRNRRSQAEILCPRLYRWCASECQLEPNSFWGSLNNYRSPFHTGIQTFDKGDQKHKISQAQYDLMNAPRSKEAGFTDFKIIAQTNQQSKHTRIAHTGFGLWSWPIPWTFLVPTYVPLTLFQTVGISSNPLSGVFLLL